MGTKDIQPYGVYFLHCLSHLSHTVLGDPTCILARKHGSFLGIVFLATHKQMSQKGTMSKFILYVAKLKVHF